MNVADARRDLARLHRSLNLQAHHLRAGFDPLTQLRRQASLIGDRLLADAAARARTASGRPWLAQSWSTSRSIPLSVLRGHAANVDTLVFSPDGTRLASGSRDGTVRLWDVASGAEIAAVAVDETVECVALSPGGRFAAIGLRSGDVGVFEVVVP